MELKEIYKERFLEKLENLEIDNEIKSINSKLIFNSVMLGDQIEVFTNPCKSGDITGTQRNHMKKLINKLSYAKNEELMIRVKVDGSDTQNFINSYIKNLYLDFEASITEKLNISVLTFLEKERSRVINAKDAINFYKHLNALKSLSSQILDFDTFINKTSIEIIDQLVLVKNKQLIQFLIDLLSEDNQKLFSFKKKWLSLDLVQLIEKLKNKLNEFISHEFNKFELKIEDKIEQNLIEFYKSSIDKATSLKDIEECKIVLLSLQKQGRELVHVNTFINNVHHKILLKNEKDGFLEESKLFESFNQEMSNKIKFTRIWIGKLIFTLNNLINEVKEYSNTNENIYFDPIKSVVSYHGYFGKLSSFLSKINSNLTIKDLKSVKVFMTHSFIFDVDYKINKDKYFTHTPDLIIISRLVKIEKNRTVDLSFDCVPNFPDNKSKAQDGVHFGEHGVNGKPGLPGFNGGNFFIFSNEISGKNNLKVITTGGKGGPGQNGNLLQLNVRTLVYFNYFRRKWCRREERNGCTLF